MKRFVLTIFLVIFSVSIIGRTVERTASWAAQHSNNDDFKHSTPNRAGSRMGEGRKHTPWQVHTKLLEHGYMAVSFDRSTDPTLSESAVHHSLGGAAMEQIGRTLSPRAPPSLL
jgi:hypothetical protein